MSGHDSINTGSCQDKLADPRTRAAVVAGALLWGANLVQLVPVCYEVHSLSMDHSTWVGLHTIYTCFYFSFFQAKVTMFAFVCINCILLGSHDC